MIAFLKTGPGMKIAEPSNPTTPFSLGAGMFATSSAYLHAARSWTDGTTIQVSTKAEFKSGRMFAARAPRPIMHVTLLSGRDLVPPKCIMMFLFASAAKITVSNSSTKSRSFASVETSEPKTSLKARRFLFPASLFA